MQKGLKIEAGTSPQNRPTYVRATLYQTLVFDFKRTSNQLELVFNTGGYITASTIKAMTTGLSWAKLDKTFKLNRVKGEVVLTNLKNGNKYKFSNTQRLILMSI